jgi:hypothetical protein
MISLPQVRKLIYAQYVVGLVLFVHGDLQPEFAGFYEAFVGGGLLYLAVAEHLVYFIVRRRRRR